MAQICAARSERFTITRDAGTPVGIDARLVVELELTPQITTGVLHASSGAGQIGAGVAHQPLEPFRAAVEALAAELRWMRKRSGPAAARCGRCVPAGAASVEFVLRAGGYVRFGDRWRAARASPRAPLGPLSVLVAGLDARRSSSARGRVVAGGALHVRRAARGSTSRARRVAAAQRQVVPLHGGLAVRARRGAQLLSRAGRARGRRSTRFGAAPWPTAVAVLAGRGPGLTPAGDDVLAGFAGWRHADGEQVSLASPRGSPIGLAYLDCAERGELPEAAQRTLDAVRAGDAALAVRRARVLARWGATSGGAMLWGMAAASGAT